MSTIEQIKVAVDVFKELNCPFELMHTVSTYPMPDSDANLLCIPMLAKEFNCDVGYSGHETGLAISYAAVALGATFIEKHFTISREDGGVDSDFSLEPSQMKDLVRESKRAWEAKGIISYGPTKKESKSLIFRRSIYVVKDIKKGESFTKENIKSIRPGLGLPIKYISKIIGRKACKDLKKGTPISWEHF